MKAVSACTADRVLFARSRVRRSDNRNATRVATERSNRGPSSEPGKKCLATADRRTGDTLIPSFLRFGSFGRRRKGNGRARQPCLPEACRNFVISHETRLARLGNDGIIFKRSSRTGHARSRKPLRSLLIVASPVSLLETDEDKGGGGAGGETGGFISGL